MAGATYVLDKTYKCTETNGISRFRAAIFGTNDGEVKLPTAANQVAAGIAQETQANGKQQTFRKYGISRAYAKGTITKGDFVEIGDAAGGLQKADLTSSAIHNILGMAETSAADGEIFFVFLSPGPCGKTA